MLWKRLRLRKLHQRRKKKRNNSKNKKSGYLHLSSKSKSSKNVSKPSPKESTNVLTNNSQGKIAMSDRGNTKIGEGIDIPKKTDRRTKKGRMTYGRRRKVALDGDNRKVRYVSRRTVEEENDDGDSVLSNRECKVPEAIISSEKDDESSTSEKEFIQKTIPKEIQIVQRSSSDNYLVNFNQVCNRRNINYLFDMMIKKYYGSNRQQKPLKNRFRAYSLFNGVDTYGFRLLGYPGSHLCYSENITHHQCHSVMFGIPNSCNMLIREDFLHSGAPSRNPNGNAEITAIPDTRYFCYVQEIDGKSPNETTSSLRSNSSQCPVGNQNPSPPNLCPKLRDNSPCTFCNTHGMRGQKEVHVHSIISEDEINVLSPGSVILGDLDEYGFVIFKTNHKSASLLKHIRQMKIDHKSSITNISDHVNRKILFSTTTKEFQAIPDVLNDPLHKHMTKVVKNLVAKIVDHKCNMIRPNILYNAGPIPNAQEPHFDYPIQRSDDNLSQIQDE